MKVVRFFASYRTGSWSCSAIHMYCSARQKKNYPKGNSDGKGCLLSFKMGYHHLTFNRTGDLSPKLWDRATESHWAGPPSQSLGTPTWDRT